MTVCDINLIAGRRRQKQRAVTVMRVAVYSFISLVIAVGLLYGGLAVATRSAAGEISVVDAELTDPVLSDKVTRIHFLEAGIAELNPRVDLLQKVHDSEEAWIRILRDVGVCIPRGVWVTQFSSKRVDKEQSLTIKGKAGNQSDIGEFMLALDKPGWSAVPRLGFTQTTTSKTGCDLIDFEVTVPLKKMIGSDIK